MIRTVLGDLDIPYGPILAHEHLQIDISHHKGPDTVLGLSEEDDVTADLRNVVETFGLKAVADLSVIGAGRNAEVLRRIATNAGLAVIAASGFYWDPLPPMVADRTEEQLAKFMAEEIRHGVDCTDICCGVIKIGTDYGEPTPVVERVFRAAVRAAKATGVSIITHTSKPEQADWHIDALNAAGMDLSRVLISHIHRFENFDQIRRIVERGTFIGFDQIGFKHGPSMDQVADVTARICHEGLGGQLILASDMARKSRLSRYGGSSYGTVFSHFIGLLKQRNIQDTQIEQLMQDNPRKLLSMHAEEINPVRSYL